MEFNENSANINTDVASVDSVQNLQINDVIGNKADTAAIPGNTTSIIAILKKIYSAVIGISGATVTDILHEQASVPVSFNTDATEQVVLDLSVVDTQYIIHNLRLKSANLGVDFITVKLYELINNVDTIVVDTFVIDDENDDDYHTLMGMFGIAQLAGDDIKITLQSSAGVHAITGQYSYGKNNVA